MAKLSVMKFNVILLKSTILVSPNLSLPILYMHRKRKFMKGLLRLYAAFSPQLIKKPPHLVTLIALENYFLQKTVTFEPICDYNSILSQIWL